MANIRLDQIAINYYRNKVYSTDASFQNDKSFIF